MDREPRRAGDLQARDARHRASKADARHRASKADAREAGHAADRDGQARIPLAEPAPLTPAVFHILLALADGPLHGYAIMKAVAESAGPGLAMGPGTIYGSLQRMEEAGLVEEVARREEDRRRRFGMLPAGRRALGAEVARLTRLANLVRARNLLRWETE
jgi:DNA-binding PadR family transcriptional regulator